MTVEELADTIINSDRMKIISQGMEGAGNDTTDRAGADAGI